jgi:hypothetical protein
MLERREEKRREEREREERERDKKEDSSGVILQRTPFIFYFLFFSFRLRHFSYPKLKLRGAGSFSLQSAFGVRTQSSDTTTARVAY